MGRKLLIAPHFSCRYIERLFQFTQCLFDATQCFDDVLVAGGITHAEALGRAECIAANSRYMTFFEQIHGEVRGGLDNLVAKLLAIVGTALGEEVESALRLVDLEAGNLTAQLYDEVTTTLEGLAHLLYGLLCATVSGFGGLL